MRCSVPRRTFGDPAERTPRVPVQSKMKASFTRLQKAHRSGRRLPSGTAARTRQFDADADFAEWAKCRAWKSGVRCSIVKKRTIKAEGPPVAIGLSRR